MLQKRNGKKAHRLDRHASLLAKIQATTARVGIVGLGYVGLPLARAFSSSGFSVLGFDVDAEKIARLKRGQSYIAHISAETLGEMLDRGFDATDRFERLAETDV